MLEAAFFFFGLISSNPRAKSSRSFAGVSARRMTFPFWNFFIYFHPSLSRRGGFSGKNDSIRFVLHHEQVMVHAVLIQVSVALSMLPRSEQID